MRSELRGRCRARDWVVNSMNLNSMAKLSLFETNIRILGGLLAAFDLSQDTRLLNKARDLADRLLPNFDLATTGELGFRNDRQMLGSCMAPGYWGS